LPQGLKTFITSGSDLREQATPGSASGAFTREQRLKPIEVLLVGRFAKGRIRAATSGLSNSWTQAKCVLASRGVNRYPLKRVRMLELGAVDPTSPS
jgi:hypothetical protein